MDFCERFLLYWCEMDQEAVADIEYKIVSYPPWNEFWAETILFKRFVQMLGAQV